MSNKVYSKLRVLVNQSVTADTQLPAFPTGPNADGRVLFAGAMRGAEIGGAELVIADLTGITAVDVKLQHSDDGSTWYDLVDEAGNTVAFTQATANGSEYIDIEDDTSIMKYVRAFIDVTGTGSVTVKVSLSYDQCGPRDPISPPGKIDAKF